MKRGSEAAAVVGRSAKHASRSRSVRRWGTNAWCAALTGSGENVWI